jgi:hypothetical protein
MHDRVTHGRWVQQSRGEEEDRSSRVGHNKPRKETVVLTPRGGSSTSDGARNPSETQDPGGSRTRAVGRETLAVCRILKVVALLAVVHRRAVRRGTLAAHKILASVEP